MLHVIDAGAHVNDGLEHRVGRDILDALSIHVDFAIAADAVPVLLTCADHFSSPDYGQRRHRLKLQKLPLNVCDTRAERKAVYSSALLNYSN